MSPSLHCQVVMRAKLIGISILRMNMTSSSIITLGRVGDLTPGAASEVGLNNRKPTTLSFLERGKSSIKDGVSQVVEHVLDELKLQYDRQVEENKKLKEKVKRLKDKFGKEKAQQQRIQTLEGIVKELTEKNRYLERKLKGNESQLRTSQQRGVDSLSLIGEPIVGVNLERSALVEPCRVKTETREDEETQEINPADILQLADEIADADMTILANTSISSSPTVWPYIVSSSHLSMANAGTSFLEAPTASSSAARTPSGKNAHRNRFCLRRTPREKMVSQPEAPSILACRAQRRPQPPPRTIFSSTLTNKITKGRNEDNQGDENPQGLNHWKVRQSGVGVYLCGCGQSFGRKYGLDRHIRYFNEEFRFPCEFCEKRFFSSFHLNRHLRGHKQDVEHSANFGCHYFEARHPSLLDLGAHQVATGCERLSSGASRSVAASTVTSENVF